MNTTALAMLLVFLGTLPAIPVRIYASPNWRRSLARGHHAFVATCAIIFAVTSSTNGQEVIVRTFLIGIVAAFAGGIASMALTKLMRGSLPDQVPLPDERYVDPLYDWSREELKYKATHIWLPNLCGFVVAITIYAIVHWLLQL